MAIPFFTNAITVIRSTFSDTEDPYDPPSAYPTPDTEIVYIGVRAVVDVPTANVNLTIGDRIVYTAHLTCDPIDLREGDMVLESSGRTWVALGPSYVQAFFITCTEAELRLVESLAQ